MNANQSSRKTETEEDGFFDRLTSFRKEGESLNQFAKRTQIPYATLRMWGRGASPKPTTVETVAQKLSCDASWLAFGPEEEWWAKHGRKPTLTSQTNIQPRMTWKPVTGPLSISKTAAHNNICSQIHCML